MEFVGTYKIPADPGAVWLALNDPDVLKACIPGCQSLIKTDATHFTATAKLRIGPMNATFKGNVKLSELDPPRRCTLTGDGQGGVAGFAKGSAEIVLDPSDGGTILSYTAKANVGGKLAQIGQRLIDGAARQIADDFFARFSNHVVGAEAQPTLATALPSLPQTVPPAEEAASARDGATTQFWAIGLVAIIIILLTLFGLVL